MMSREQRNFQFDFLRPQHSLFQYFTKLLEQYTKVLIPPKDMMKKLHTECVDEKAVKEQARRTDSNITFTIIFFAPFPLVN